MVCAFIRKDARPWVRAPSWRFVDDHEGPLSNQSPDQAHQGLDDPQSSDQPRQL
jgi:hypothetical protein